MVDIARDGGNATEALKIRGMIDLNISLIC